MIRIELVAIDEHTRGRDIENMVLWSQARWRLAEDIWPYRAPIWVDGRKPNSVTPSPKCREAISSPLAAWD